MTRTVDIVATPRAERRRVPVPTRARADPCGGPVKDRKGVVVSGRERASVGLRFRLPTRDRARRDSATCDADATFEDLQRKGSVCTLLSSAPLPTGARRSVRAAWFWRGGPRKHAAAAMPPPSSRAMGCLTLPSRVLARGWVRWTLEVVLPRPRAVIAACVAVVLLCAAGVCTGSSWRRGRTSSGSAGNRGDVQPRARPRAVRVAAAVAERHRLPRGGLSDARRRLVVDACSRWRRRSKPYPGGRRRVSG